MVFSGAWYFLEEKRTKEGGTPLNFLSVTAALPLDDTGIFESFRQHICFLHMCGEQVANKSEKSTEDTDIAFDREQSPARGEHV